MKWLILSLLLVAPLRADEVMNCAKYEALPGRKVYNSCDAFAVSLHWRLKQLGVRHYIVRFKWTSGRDSGFHALVLFYHGGKLYVVDNFTGPCWVEDQSSLAAILKAFDPILDHVEIVSVTQ